MAVAAVIMKIMPESPSTDLNAIKNEAEKRLAKDGAKNFSFEEKNVAFGLKSVTIKFAWPEEKSTDIIENHLNTIPHVSSVTMEDYRRAFG